MLPITSVAARIAVFNVRGLCLSVLSVLSLYGISGLSKVSTAQTDTPQRHTQNIERRGSPRAMQDFDRYGNQVHSAWFDRGSWHGLLLPDAIEDRAGFNGPMIIAEEYAVYLARSLDTLELIDTEAQQALDKSQAQWQFQSRNGELQQSLSWPDLRLTLRLRFISAHTALIKTDIENRRPSSRSLQLRWHGELLQQWQTSDSASAEKKTLVAKVVDKFPAWQRNLRADQHTLFVELGRLRSATDIMISGSSRYWITRQLATATDIKDLAYSSLSAPIQLQPHSHFTTYTAHHYALDADDLKQASNSANLVMQAPRLAWIKTEQAWRLLAKRAKTALQSKAMETMLSNWRHPAGALAFDGVVPSTTSRWFNCMWGWDSFKHAYALADIDPQLAQQQMRLMLSAQIQADDKLRPQDAGMIIDDVCYNRDVLRGGDGSNWNERNTKPPLATWASWRIFESTRDITWLREVYPKLKVSHQWWYSHRDTNHNGLIEFGATNHPEHNNPQGELKFSIAKASAVWRQRCNQQDQAANPETIECFGIGLYRQAQREGLAPIAPAQEATGYESGMDNAARFGFIDDDQLKKYAEQQYTGDLQKARLDWQVDFFENRSADGKLLGYSMNQESVDLNAFLYADKLYLAKMAARLGLHNEAGAWRTSAAQLKSKINRCFFDEKSGYFYDRKIATTQQLDQDGCADGQLLTHRGRGSEAFAVLWANAADAEHAQAVIKHWRDRNEFASYLPFPTAALSNPAFHPTTYWRGRVWVDQVYFALKGLQNYGHSKLAQEFARQFISRAEGINDTRPLRENYDPLTGAGQGPGNFSWTAAHLWMIDREVLRVGEKTAREFPSNKRNTPH